MDRLNGGTIDTDHAAPALAVRDSNGVALAAKYLKHTTLGSGNGIEGN